MFLGHPEVLSEDVRQMYNVPTSHGQIQVIFWDTKGPKDSEAAHLFLEREWPIWDLNGRVGSQKSWFFLEGEAI